MPLGEGRGWAKGKTAAIDPRVARAAASHRGIVYERRTPVELCRWPGLRRSPKFTWSRDLAHLVGLVATDGCLTERGHQIDFVSRDLQLVETFLHCLRRSVRYRSSATRAGNALYRAQFKDAALYRWLVEVGITPRKSLTLGALNVPDEHLAHAVRGLLDGDGSIVNKVSRFGSTGRGDYYWEYLRTQFVSASEEHLVWLRQKLQLAVGIRGYVSGGSPRGTRHPLYQLGYGKQESVRLLGWLYSDTDAPCLVRKRSIWDDYRKRHGL